MNQDDNIKKVDHYTELKIENVRLSNELIRLQIEKVRLEIASITSRVKRENDSENVDL